MEIPIILASGSQIRRELLANSGLVFTVQYASIDEDEIKETLERTGCGPDDMALALAYAKAQKVSINNPGSLVIGCDQILDVEGVILSKPETKDVAISQLNYLSGRQHSLFSAAVVFEQGQEIWRAVNEVRMTMRGLSQQYVADYVMRNWQSIRHTVGCYKLEQEGVRLFSKIEGDYFTVLGLPLLEVLGYLTDRTLLQG